MNRRVHSIILVQSIDCHQGVCPQLVYNEQDWVPTLRVLFNTKSP